MSSRQGHAVLLSLLLLALLLALLPVSGAKAATAPEADRQYSAAKQDLERLLKDEKRAAWRDPWEKLAGRFLEIYESSPDWTSRPAALFRSALAMEELGKRSRRPSDSREALARYERLVREHPKSALADDALYHAAVLKAERLSDMRGALSLLRRIVSDYAGGDFAGQAAQYAEKLSAGLARQSETAMLTGVRWRDANGFVQLVLSFDKPVAWSVTSRPQNTKNGNPDRLIITLANTIPASTIRPVSRTSASLLRRLRVDLTTPDATRLFLDFRKLRRFTVTSKTDPFRLIITGSPTDKGMPKGTLIGRKIHSDPELYLKNMTVVIDAGHGGKDPGTVHNGVTESDITLDLARRTGDILAARKINVHYTRMDNAWVSLDARTQVAKEAEADVFVSIHVNASDNTAATGFELYVPGQTTSAETKALAGREGAGGTGGKQAKRPQDPRQSERMTQSRTLAEAIRQEVMANLGRHKFTATDGGIRSAPFRVLNGISMPGVLLEVGYCTNEQEAKKLLSPAYRQALAEGIAAGILAAGRKTDD